MRTDLSSAGHGFREGSTRRSSASPSEEERLVAGCLRREETAWATMFRLYHPQLVSIIRALIHHGEDATEQAEEIAAVVWSSLYIDAQGRLKRYDARTDRLLFHLARLARREIWKGRRSARNRYYRECKVARLEATADNIGLSLDIEDFLATLTPSEREFFLSDLLRQSTHTVRSGVSLTNEWKLRSRVLKKFRMYFLQDN